MRQFNKYRDTEGFVVAAERGIRWRYMIQKTAEKRALILTFWHRYGLAAACEAFQVSRPTLFRWQAKLKVTKGKLEGLNKGSTVPKTKRQRIIPLAIQDFIIKERQYDPHLSKDKLAVLLKADGVAVYSASTVGRMLGDLKKQGKLPKFAKLSFYARTGKLIERKPVKRRVKLRSRGHEGELVKADSIVRFTNGIKRYIVTAMDCGNKFAFAYAYANHSSTATADFLDQFRRVSPFPITHLQTDNGSEFAKHFEVALAQHGIVHFHTYPRSPKMNSEIERFNRTLIEAFVNTHRLLLAYDLEEFNRQLMDWLLWYNTRRPHWSLGLVCPLRYICNQLAEPESQMCWTDTRG